MRFIATLIVSLLVTLAVVSISPAHASTTVACSAGGSFVVSANVVRDGLSCGGEAVFPEGVTTINTEASKRVTSLTSIRIPTTVTQIQVMAFMGASSLSSVTFAAGSQLSSILDYGFDGTAITSITLPATLTSIGNYAFFGTTSLTTISFAPGSQITTIGTDAFHGARALTSITIPSSVTSIGAYAFQDARSLTSIEIPAGVTSIGNDAFTRASSLTSVRFLGNAPSSVGANAFSTIGASAKFLISETATGFDGVAWSSRTVERDSPPPRSNDNTSFTPLPQVATKPEALSKPKLSGQARVSRTLTVSEQVWTGNPTPKLSFRWYACTNQVRVASQKVPKSCTMIKGAKGEKFKLTAKQSGKFVSVLVTGTGAGNSTTKWISKSSSRVT